MRRAAEHKDKVRQTNLETHGEMLTLSLSQVAEALSRLILERDTAEAGVAAAKIERAELLVKNDATKREINARLAAALEAEQQIKAAQIVAKSTLDILGAEAKLCRDTIGGLNLRISQKNGTITELQATIRGLLDKHSWLVESIASLESKIIITTKELNDIEATSEAAKRTFKTEAGARQKELMSMTNELAKISALVDDERKKIEKPLQILAQEQAKLDSTRRDLDIYRSRTTTQFRKAFPSQQIKL